MNQELLPFGHVLRKARLQKGFGLRQFAELVGVSPTYLSQVEQCNADPPTVERVRRMAELLGVNADAWTALAGRVPEDLQEIIRKHPTELAELLRAVSGLNPEQLRKLVGDIKRMK